MTTDDFRADVASGDIRRALGALRDRLAAELDGKRGPGVASLARVLLEVLRDLHKLPDEHEQPSLVDELAARHRRRSGAVPMDPSFGQLRNPTSGKRPTTGKRSGRP
jgi:hypothetical protein